MSKKLRLAQRARTAQKHVNNGTRRRKFAQQKNRILRAWRRGAYSNIRQVRADIAATVERWG